MSDSHKPDGPTVCTADRDWSIHRCSHGCVHISFDRLMVTLRQHEFRAFARMVLQATERLDLHDGVHEPVARPH